MGEAWADLPPQASVETELTPLYASYWRAAKPGDSIGKINQAKKLRFDAPSPTLVRKEGNGGVYHPAECRKLSLLELMRLQSFPDDWRFVGSRTAHIPASATASRRGSCITSQATSETTS